MLFGPLLRIFERLVERYGQIRPGGARDKLYTDEKDTDFQTGRLKH